MWNKVLLNKSRILTHSSKSAENIFKNLLLLVFGIQLNVIACFIVNTQIIMKLIFQTNNQMMRVFFCIVLLNLFRNVIHGNVARYGSSGQIKTNLKQLIYLK